MGWGCGWGALTEPFGVVAAAAVFGVVFEAGGDEFGCWVWAELEDEPLAGGHEWEGEASGGLGDGEFDGFLPSAAGGGEGLACGGERFHIVIEQGDVELISFDGDFAMEGFIIAELEDAAAVGSEFKALMGEAEAGEEGGEEQMEEGGGGVHG